MPWPATHKSETRARIVEQAAAALRARGVSGVGVAEIMAAAGLTHGGFYAHFASKNDLLRAALARADAQTVEALASTSGSLDEPLQAVIDRYLSPAHAAHPERGCPVAALGPELVREGGQVHRDLGRAVRARLAWLRGLLPARASRRRQDEEAAGILACLIGGVILARAVGPDEAPEILAACRAFLRGAVNVDSSSGASLKRAEANRSRLAKGARREGRT